MAMQPESLEVLEKADVAPAQARAIVRAIEIELAGARDVLATKHDLVELGASLRGEMSELGASLRGEMSELGASLRGEMSELGASLRTEMSGLGASLRTEMSELRASLRGEMSDLAATLRSETSELGAELRGQIADADMRSRTEIAALRTDMATWRGELKAEIHAVVGNGTRQMYMALLGQMAVLLGFAYFFATHVR
jgi:hypothetical protein